MVTETMVSYYGLTYPEHAARDFDEMLDHNCNAVLLAITEFDMFFWYPNVLKIVETAKEKGLTPYLNLWGIGKFFGGEPLSLFLQENVNNRQVSAFTGEPVPAACMNSRQFREYFFELLEKLARDSSGHGFFWDEPHYFLPSSLGLGDDWTCRCSICQKRFSAEYGYDMPKVLTNDVIRFRKKVAKEILLEGARVVKGVRPDTTVTICPLPRRENFYAPDLRGYGDWEDLAACPEFDIFSSSIIDYDASWRFFEEVTQRTAELARRHGKKAQRWIQIYHKSPENPEFIKKLVHMYADKGIDSIGAWTYRAGMGTSLNTDGSDSLSKIMWDTLGEAYGEVLK